MSESNQDVIPNTEDQVDRISKLPDTVLSLILSFLPTRSAVATSILSERWRYAWTLLPFLDFTELPSSMTNTYLDKIVFNKEQYFQFRKYANRVLLLSNAPCLRHLHFVMHKFFPHRHVFEWMSVIAKLQVINLCCINKNPLVAVPSHFFSNKFCLTFLELRGFLVFLPSLFPFPRLQRFALIKAVLASNDGNPSVDPWKGFLSNCPVLEELIIDDCGGFEKLTICSTSIKTLELSLERGPNKTIIIETPNLEFLSLATMITNSDAVSDLPSLNEAILHVSTSRIRWVKLLQKISHTMSLNLYDIVLDGLSANIQFPIFQNLTHLEVGYTRWPIVLQIIEKAPKLVAFIISGFMFDWPDKKPRKMELPLERIECFYMEDCCRMVRYILSNSGLLKEFKFCIDGGLSLERRYKTLKKLLKFPRASNQCKIIFLIEGEDNDSESEGSADDDGEADAEAEGVC